MILPDRFATTDTWARRGGPAVTHDIPNAQQKPGAGQHRAARVIDWALFIPEFLEDLTPTLAEVEAFCARARAAEAPDTALVLGMGSNPSVRWYVAEEEQPAHLVDGEGDVWVETGENEFGCVDFDVDKDDPNRIGPQDTPLESISRRYNGINAEPRLWA